MNMYIHENRLLSFYTNSKKSKWPHKESEDFKATPESLAKAGFYFNPIPNSKDNVVCFLCNKSMEGWDSQDDPFEEHVKHSPDCAWAICYCSIRNFNEDQLPFNWDDKDKLPTSKKMEDARIKTFGTWWPHAGKKGWVGTVKKMAKAGFIYSPTIGSLDNVTCQYCGVGLEGWEQKDDPTKEHNKRFPLCPFFAKPPSKLKNSKTKKSKTTTKTGATKKTRKQDVFKATIKEEETELSDMINQLSLNESSHDDSKNNDAEQEQIYSEVIKNNCADDDNSGIIIPTSISPDHLMEDQLAKTLTVEDYLKDLTEQQERILAEKTNQLMEAILEIKRRAKNAIMTIPIPN
ncbi:inhibitor of apoptosis repeat-containing protein [Gigaspora margarita]|uniref:Inhibitor of apoptosis repeat-containing protein n=1 Tax=Gigaspora margarita TaxID=4874 RepID=A0A8H4B536_GIGMA|nr:inhibitor of apoptosis repeat-containing protein [Gigaspora margarita]